MIKKLTTPQPAPQKTQALTIQPDPARPLLRLRDGWFFGLGFFAAAFVFSFIKVV